MEKEGGWVNCNTLIESEGSEPDKAAFLAAARLSTSSEASPDINNYMLKRRKMEVK
jgi:hypothetical protein